MKEKSINLRHVPVSMRRALFAFLFFSAWATPNLCADQLEAKEVVLNEQSLQSQQVAVSGIVSDANGEPLIGVSVKVKGATVGTATDIDGKFSLNVPSTSAVLVFSYVGYATQEITVGSKTSFDVVMQDDSKMLDQVVVTALGMKRSEKSLGYSVTEVKGDDLNKNVVNPVSALQGKVAGVEISGADGGLFGSNKIQIRGASTLKGNNQPIYVVDGVILDNGIQNASADWDSDAGDWGNALKNLNPDDFESVSVLKGAPATALYGSRGLNGAVVITTKGGGKQKGFGVSLSQTIGIDVVTKVPKQQTTYGVGNYSGNVTYGELNADGTFKKWDNLGQFALSNIDGVSTHSLYAMAGQTSRYWGPKYDGSAIQLYDQTMGVYSPTKNNYKDAFRTGFNTNTNVIVRGGNEKTSFYSSTSFRYAEGTQDRNSFNRLSQLLKGTHQISDRVNVAGSISFSQSQPKNPVKNIGEYFASSLGPSYDTKYYKNKYFGDNHTGMASATYGDKYANVPGKGMWWSIYQNTTEQKETVVRPTLDVNVKIADWVSFKAEANMNFFELRREVKNLGTGFNNEGTEDATGGKYEMYYEDSRQETYAGTFSFNKDLNDFYVGGFIRGELYNRNEAFSRSKTDKGLIIPGQYFLANSHAPIIADAKISSKKRMLSAIFAANLAWRNQVFVDITGRNDWSSSLVTSAGTGNYSYFYPSITGSWILTETLKESLPTWMSFGKVRASWAQVGNDMDPFLINMGYEIRSYLQNGGNSIYANQMPEKRILVSDNLKPERKNAIEFGLDWRFLDNRIGIDATYYKENTKDQIMDVDISEFSGYKKMTINAGNIQNQGIELALKTVPFRNKDIEWTLDFTYTKNKSKIVSLSPEVQNYITLDGDVDYGNYRIGAVAKVGGEYGMLATDSNPKKDDDGNVLLTWRDDFRVAMEQRSGDIEYIGSLMPKFLGSVSTGLTYKDFSLRVGLDMRYGGYVASYNNRYGMAYGITEASLKYRDSENGGITWTSQFADSKGMTFHDGYIPEGVFDQGTTVVTPSGAKKDVSGMSFREAYESGYVEPVHGSTWSYWNNSWGTGVVNKDWVHELKYIALREVSVSYRVPSQVASKIGARNMNLTLTGRNLGYLYNSLPNDLNPEGIRGNSSASFRERGYIPYTSSFMFTIGLDF